MKGLHNKYNVTKANGKPIEPNAEYFVLRLDTDKHARAAAKAYADSVEHDNEKLASQLHSKIASYEMAELGDMLCNYCDLPDNMQGIFNYGNEPVMCRDSSHCVTAYRIYLNMGDETC